jgi:hypothetical protein
MAKRGWFGEPGRHARAARLGWNRRLRADGRRLDYIKSRTKRGAKYIGSRVKKGAKKVGRAAVEAAKDTGREWKDTGKEVMVKTFPTTAKVASHVKKRVGADYQRFLEEEGYLDDEGYLDEEIDEDLEGTKLTHVKGHVRRKSSSAPARKKVVRKKVKPKRK